MLYLELGIPSSYVGSCRAVWGRWRLVLSEPQDRLGLAHFHEHMLFLGTEKFPKEDEYSKYLSAWTTTVCEVIACRPPFSWLGPLFSHTFGVEVNMAVTAMPSRCPSTPRTTSRRLGKGTWSWRCSSEPDTNLETPM